MRTVYVDPSAGFSPLSREFLGELIRGMSAGLGLLLPIVALPVLVIVGVGFGVLFKRNRELILALALPGILQVIFSVARGLVTSPRFFLLALPLACLVLVQGVYNIALYTSRVLRKERVFAFRLSTALVLLVCVASLVQLRYSYSLPKQAYLSSLKYIEATRQPSDIVIVVHLAEVGYRYYGKRLGIEEGKNYFFARSVETFDTILSSNNGKRAFLVTTFHRALHIRYPDLEARIRRDWTVARTFPGTIGDGDISVWKQRQL